MFGRVLLSQFTVCVLASFRAFGVLRREQNRYYVQVTPSWQNLETHRMLCIPALPMFAHYKDAFGRGLQPPSRLLCDTVIM